MNQAQQHDPNTPSAHYLDKIFRRRWLLVTAIVGVWAAALGVSLLMPAKYKSETLVLVEQDNVPAQFVTPIVSIDLQQRLRSMAEQVMSRTRLAQIAQQDHLYGQQTGQTASEASVDQMRADMTVELIKPAGQAEVSAFKISYSAQSPEMAQKVTSQLSSLFIQDSLADQQQLSADTTQSLQTQFSAAQTALEQQDKLLSDFKMKHLGELPEQLSGNVQVLSGLKGRLGSATTALHQAEQQRLYLSSMLASPRTAGDTSTPGVATPLDLQIEKMKEDLASLSALYTPRHPDIVRLKEQIANAERNRRQADNPVSTGTASGQTDGSAGQRTERSNSAGGQLASQLKATDLEIANRKQEVSDLQRQIGQYQGRLNLTPLRQQQLAEVNRNHDQAQTNFDAVLAKKQQSGMATDMANRRQGGQFRMIDPPSLPQKPYAPNRLRFSGIGLFLGVLLGLASIVFLETVDARVYGEDDLKGWISAPVIATVPPLTTPAEKKQLSRQHSREIILASLLVVLVPAITFVVYLKG